MKSGLKEVFRLIVSTKAYFLTIILVTCFSVLTYTGISFSTASMVQTCEEYYNEHQFHDIQAGSIYGFTDENIAALNDDSRIDRAEAVYYSQELIKIGSNDYVAEFYSKAETLNVEKLKQGRIPEKDTECLIEQSLADRFDLKLGDTIVISTDSGNVAYNEFKIVGTADLVTVFVSNDFYNRGTSDLGDGQVTTKIMIPETAFENKLPKQLCYITIRNHGYRGSEEYDAKIDRIRKDLKRKIRVMGEENRSEIKQRMEKKLEKQTARYDSARTMYDNARSLIAKAERQLPEKKKELKRKEKELEKARSKLPALKQASEKATADYTAAEEELSTADSRVEELRKELEKAENPEERARLQKEYDEAVSKADSLRHECSFLMFLKDRACGIYDSARNKVNSAQKKISSAKSAIAETEARVEDAKAEVKAAGPELEKAEKRLVNAKTRIDNLAESQVFVSDIHDNPSYAYYVESIEGTDKVVTALCSLLMAIAVLVCITTVGRMVTEQHRYIGTQKALGFRNREIRSRFILYVLFAAFCGIVIGTLASYLFFQKWVFTAVYGKCFIIDGFTPIIDWKVMVAIFLIESAVMIICAWAACRQMLARSAISLLNSNIRNSSHLAGGFSHFSNEMKMILRNLRSNPQIMLTTIVSVLGCTALMISSLTVYHGMAGVSDMQYRELQHYQGTITIDSDAEEEDSKAIDDYLRASDLSVLPVFERFIPYETGEGKQYGTIMGIDGEDSYSDFLEIKDASTGADMTIPDDGVLICKRISEKYGFSEGDTINLCDSMGNEYETIVRGVFDRYVGMAIITDPEYYGELTGTDISRNQYYVKGNESDIKETISVAQNYDAFCNYSDAAYFEAEMNFKMKCILMIVLIMLGTTGILSVVVITDLVQMNIQKKEKDIVVMKVLGYPKKRIFGYVFWESMIMCTIGVVIGIVIGAPLGNWLIRIVEMDSLQFIRGISPVACACGGGINLVFCLVANIIALRGVKKIKMTGSAREA